MKYSSMVVGRIEDQGDRVIFFPQTAVSRTYYVIAGLSSLDTVSVGSTIEYEPYGANFGWFHRVLPEATKAEVFFHELEEENPLPPGERAEIDIPFTLAANLMRLRKARGMDAAQFAKTLGVTPQRMSQIERGDANVTIGMLARIATSLDCDVRELLSPTSY